MKTTFEILTIKQGLKQNTGLFILLIFQVETLSDTQKSEVEFL